MSKLPFKGLTIAVTGDFGGHRSIEKMRQWVQVNGGIFSYEISPKVTHLICSKEHFNKNVTLVRQARKLQSVRIVSFDWLEDSLMYMTRKREGEYLLGRRLQNAEERKAKKKAVRKNNIRNGMAEFEKGCQAFQEDMFSEGYHIYRDCTAFAYDITLARANLLLNKNERSMLKLYETHAEPKIYACYGKFSSPGQQSTAEVLAPIGSAWEVAWLAFLEFFERKTWKTWDMRFFKASAAGPDAFVYTPPKEGHPRGVFLKI